MNAELTHELGYEKHSKAEKPTPNRRNGSSAKTVSSKHGEMEILVPRDRAGEFESQNHQKHQRRFDGFDNLILSLYSRGLSTREIQSHIEEIYGVEVSPDLVSTVTSAVEEKSGMAAKTA
jgi:putative transposase